MEIVAIGNRQLTNWQLGFFVKTCGKPKCGIDLILTILGYLRANEIFGNSIHRIFIHHFVDGKFLCV